MKNLEQDFPYYSCFWRFVNKRFEDMVLSFNIFLSRVFIIRFIIIYFECFTISCTKLSTSINISIKKYLRAKHDFITRTKVLREREFPLCRD